MVPPELRPGLRENDHGLVEASPIGRSDFLFSRLGLWEAWGLQKELPPSSECLMAGFRGAEDNPGNEAVTTANGEVMKR
jgi:hypothetical protein